MKTDLEFDKKYTMYSDIKSIEMCPESQTGMFETYGNDFQTVLKIYKENPLKVWTMVDGDDGMYLVNGLCYVNRVYYMLTNENAENEFEEYLFDSYGD